jgi:hypothetical protein
MNRGFEILIARTKTHPEEFYGWETGSHIASRWTNMMENFSNHMTEEEKLVWEEAKVGLNEWYANKRRDDFTQAVMKELLIREGEEEIDRAIRPQPDVGSLRFNHTQNKHEVYAGNQVWQEIPQPVVAGGGGGGSGIIGSGGGGGSVVVKTPTGTHTFTKNGTFTG